VVDVRDKEGLKKAIDNTAEKYKKIDILVNNAGILRPEKFTEVSDESRDLQIDVNINGVWNATQLVLPYMIEKEYGRIINLSSVTGEYVCDPGSVCYAMTKAALVGFTKGIAVEYAERGITSNALCPGWVKTPAVEKFAKDERPEDPDALLTELAEGLPVKRLGVPKDIGVLAAFLAGEDAGFITGATIVIDGGSILPES
ncbi:MAG: SDR family oxidoreductase, partial [Lachnospiraceae bacterium]|nr:SDR family oxidoreductase [Lachnospiraceae bacterium]